MRRQLGQLKRLKQAAPGMTIAVAGCVAQAEGEVMVSGQPREVSTDAGSALQLAGGMRVRARTVVLAVGNSLRPLPARGFHASHVGGRAERVEHVTVHVDRQLRLRHSVKAGILLEAAVAEDKRHYEASCALGRLLIARGLPDLAMKPLTQLIGFDYDADGNRTATAVQLGNTAPDFRMGFVNDVTFGPWSLTGVLDYQNGGSIINLTQFLYDDAQSAADFGTPAYDARRRGYLTGVMAPYIEDATFLKLREIGVSYTVPTNVVQSIGWGADNLRLSLTGRNLASWQKYSGLDPEVANLGSAAIRNNLDVAAYPPSRSFFLNIAVGF